MDSLFSVDTTNEKNRFLKANTSISQGSLLLKAEPLIIATFSHNRHQYCNFCLKQKDSLLKCGKCMTLHYCSSDCQRQDWTLHKKECLVYQKIGQKPTKITNQFMFILRGYLKYQENKDDFCKKIDQMISNVDNFPEEKLQFFQDIALMLIKYHEDQTKIDATSFISFIRTFASKIMVNAFTIHNNDNDTIAAALYSPSNFVNHSCDPNAIVIYKGKKQCIYSLKPLEKDQEITVSYCSYIKPFYDRYRYLSENYFFECTCSRCQKDLTGCDTTLTCQKCKEKSITQKGVESFICEKCSKDWTLQEIYLMDQNINKLKADMGTQKLEDRIKSWQKLQGLISEDSGHYSEIYEIISRTYIAEEKFDEAFASDKALLKKMKKWYIPGDPAIGWKYLELAKLASALTLHDKSREYAESGLKVLDKYYLLEEMPDFKELILDIQHNFEYSMNYDALGNFKN